jgi:PAS domain S-box-containing protein
MDRIKPSRYFIDEPFLESLDEWVWEMDLNGIHTYSNAAVEKILGFKVEEVVGFSTTKLWPRIDSRNNEEKLKEYLQQGKGWKNYSAYFIHKDGSVKILLSSAIPVYDQNNKLKVYRGIDRDITERVMNETALRFQKEHIKLINQVLRHDLTNDLAVINSSIRLFLNTDDKTFLDETRKTLNKSLKLIHSMSEVEEFIMNNKDFKVFSAGNVLKNVIKDKQHVVFNIKGESRFMADELVYSVFDNIINNAVNHGKATEITINIENDNAKCIISILDNGKGIPDEIKGKLFEAGYKFGEQGNTGIGLHIVKQAMENYKGSVEVLDNKPQGAIFKLIFHRMG